jgi:hypothetical protein
MSLVLFHELKRVEIFKKKDLLKSILKNFIRFFFSNTQLKIEDNEETLFFKSIDRRDYNLDFSLIYNSLPSKLKSKAFLHQSFSIKFDLFAIYKNLRPLTFVRIYKTANYNDYNYIQRLYLFSSLVKYLIYVSPFFLRRFKNIIVYDESQPYENLLTQLYNQIGTNTITLQHGLYIDKGFPDINYSNLISKYFLSWGEITKNLIQKYNTGIETVICGKPSLVFENNTRLYDKKYVSVIFDHNNYIAHNRKILGIISQYCFKNDLTLNVRLHPHNKNHDYYFDKKINIIINYPILESEFVVGHSSSLLYECYIKGLKTLKLKSEIKHTQFPLNQQFKDVNELSEKLNNYKKNKNFIKDYFGYHERDSIDQYNKFFKSILC